MNDLHTIQRLNAAAVQATIPKLTAAGKWVIEVKAGLNFEDALAFDTEGQAQAQLALLRQQDWPGRSYVLHQPAAVPGEHLVHDVRPLAIDALLQDGGNGFASAEIAVGA